MPTYVYKFLDSGHTIEVQQSFHDDALTEAVHPESGATMAVKKVFLPVGVTFKGDGFYKTDSRSGQSKSTNSTSGKSDTSESSSSSSDSSSTPASSTSTAESGTSTTATPSAAAKPAAASAPSSSTASSAS